MDQQRGFFQLKFIFFLLLLLSLARFSSASELRVLGDSHAFTQSQIEKLVNQVIDKNQFREVRADVFSHYIILQLFQIGYHRVDFLRVNLSPTNEVLNIQANYKYQDQEQIVSAKVLADGCPDPSVQVIAFAPNDDPTEQGVTADVIKAAQAQGYKVIPLLKANATRANYLAYMSCPKLIGNFYDGDSNPQSFITVDGVINATEISALKGLFRYQVTNIWVACEAFNDPMLTSVIRDAQSQKYAAGINDLLVGPSDNAAACTMKSAIAGLPMTQAFQDCYKQWDQANDKWGFAGDGADIFGH